MIQEGALTSFALYDLYRTALIRYIDSSAVAYYFWAMHSVQFYMNSSVIVYSFGSVANKEFLLVQMTFGSSFYAKVSNINIQRGYIRR